MSDAIGAIQGSESSSNSQSVDPAAVTKDAVSASGAVQSSSSNKISSLADLKNQEPEFYQKMMESIAMSICNQMKDHQDRLKEMMEKARNNS